MLAKGEAGLAVLLAAPALEAGSMRSIAVTLLVLSACASAPAVPSRCVKVQRGNAAAQFRREHPCPAGPDVGSTTKCEGHQIHHVVPLACGGPDTPDNLVWLTTDQHRRLHSAMICRCELVRGDQP